MQEALRSSRNIGDVVKQFRALGILLKQLPAHLASNLASQAVSRLPGIRHAEARCALLAAVSGTLDRAHWSSLMSNEVASAANVDGDWEQAAAWCALAPFLSEEQLVAAWSSATKIANARERLRALTGLAGFVSEVYVNDVLALLKNGPADIHDALLLELAPKVAVASIPELLAVAEEIGDPRTRARAVLALSQRMDGPDRQNILRRSVELAAEVGDAATLAHGLIAQVQAWSENMPTRMAIRSALDAALRIPGSAGDERPLGFGGPDASFARQSGATRSA